GGRYRRIQRVHNGSCDLEIANQRCCKILFQRRFRRQRGGQSPLSAADQVHARMFTWEALGRARQRVSFELHKVLPHSWALEQFPELLVMIEKPVANLRELI